MFPLGTKSSHTVHVEAALCNTAEAHHCGVKRQCPISERMSYFHALDALHDLLEGIVPLELALCPIVFMKKKYVFLRELNRSIRQFPYKWNDQPNCPQAFPMTFVSRKSVGCKKRMKTGACCGC